MRITFYGAAGEVGRSFVLIESGDTRVALDAGVKLGEVEEHPTIDDADLKGIDGVILSHAHLDHCGYVPHLYASGYTGYLYATKPTLELLNVVMTDYVNISKPKDVTKESLQKVVQHFRIEEYFKEFKIKGMTIRLLPAGHILGSAMIEVSDGKEKLLYTGDINLKTTKLLDAAYTADLNANILITESTYGGKSDTFQPEKVVLGKMVADLNETLKAGGKVIMPVFAVGRAQEVLFILDDYIRSGVLPKVPIYVDGMVNKVVRIYRHNVICCKEEVQKRILMSEDDPFKSKNFYVVGGRQQRAKVLKETGACIVVTTSGMLKGGPVVKYLEKFAGDSNNKMILVGYQAVGTPGRALRPAPRR